jgi:DNA mismatch repair protein MutL
MTIRLLSQKVSSQIAAGEVVERPASVVKELIENSLDAAASKITVLVKNAGLRLIEVKDNGKGIPPDELHLAVQRHATSKLEKPQDLEKIATLGFRGEALASIGSISRLLIESNPIGSMNAAEILVEGGMPSKVSPTGAPEGTTVRVENLFYNVPARLKFLKHERTEKGHINSILYRYALAFPNVQFALHHDGRLVFHTSGNGNRREIIASIHDPVMGRALIEIESVYQELVVNGYTSPPGLTRSNRKDILFYVNHRPVQDSTLTSALLKAYHTLLMSKRYPISFIFIELPYDQVDVNVHPTKSEVRFKNTGRIFSSIQNAVRKALLAHGQIPDLIPRTEWLEISSLNQPATLNNHTSNWSSVPLEQIEADSRTFPENVDSEGDLPSQIGLNKLRVPLLRPVGQVASAYLVAEGPDGLYLIDQHAAHERILFERLSAQKDMHMASQSLLKPESIQLSTEQAEILEDQISLLSKLGFQIEKFGKDTFLLRSIPAILSKIEPVEALRLIVDDFEEDETPLESEIESLIIARICKRVAIRAGQILSQEEQSTLINDLENCQSPRTCPHGRPTMVHLSVDLLERQFGRRGPR